MHYVLPNPNHPSLSLILYCNILMGNCAGSQITREGGGYLNWPSTAKVIQLDGRVQEFRQPIEAGHILSQNPNCFLCSSETMLINSNAPQVPHHEEVQLGQIYFLMPISKSQLCALAIKASTALNNSAMGHAATKTPPFLAKNGVGFPAEPQRCCRILNSFDMVGSSQRIEFNNQLS